MKVKTHVEVEFDVKFIRIDVPVRYDEEVIPNDFPMRNGDNWNALVDIDAGIIQDYPLGKSGLLFMKVCDEGIYTLYDASMNKLASLSGYVPDVVPNEYGDYIHLKIDETGKILNWDNSGSPFDGGNFIFSLPQQEVKP